MRGELHVGVLKGLEGFLTLGLATDICHLLIHSSEIFYPNRQIFSLINFSTVDVEILILTIFKYLIIYTTT